MAPTPRKSRKRTRPDDFSDPISPKAVRTNEENQCLTIAQDILRKTWGFPEFRLKQEEAICKLLSGGSAVVVFPTGGGKSLCYQVPALACDRVDQIYGRQRENGVSLVVSPLIALMKDQVDALRNRGVAAAALDSSQTREAWLDTHKKLQAGDLKILYVAPERLNNEGFVEAISAIKIRLLAVDEAHCISQWGNSFRPDYLKVARFAKEVNAERVLCLTATATPKVVDDICAAFDIDRNAVYRTSSYRPNLRLLAESHEDDDSKMESLKSFLRNNQGPSIVYVQTHKQTEKVCQGLLAAGLKAFGYHAGMSNEARTSVQDQFLHSKDIIIVATIAFGMGIDKPDIRNVVHYAIPKSLEGYSQEIGRAGRDSLPSICLVYLCPHDLALMEQWSRADVPSIRSIEGLVDKVLETLKGSRGGDIIERDLNEESKAWDIRIISLNLLNAHLELQLGLIRAITPKYSHYQYVKSSTFDTHTADTSKVTKALKQFSKTAKKWTNVDVDAAARNMGLDRMEAVRKLQDWNDRGAIELKAGGVIHRFRVLKDVSETEDYRKSVITIIHAAFKAREKEDMAKIKSVIDMTTASTCFSGGLARYFGDEASVPEAGCGHCSYCLTKKPVDFSEAKKSGLRGKVDPLKFQAILAATSIRDDPHFLARVAFGISSPRVTMEKLAKHAVFGSMDECDFEELEQLFSEACNGK